MISNKNNHLTNIIVRQTNCLRETRFFWNSKRQQLKIMIRDLNCSSLFLTFSAIDMQWNDLYTHMFEYDVYFNAIEKEKHRLMFRLLQENSHVVIEYLNRRFRLFFEKILRKKFEIKDFWYRYEWQTRESDHVHDFIWLKNVFSFEQLKTYLVFWNSLITVINSEDALSFATRHSSNVSFFERNNIRFELAKLLNRVQKHIVCTLVYCLRQDKKTKKIVCKFHYFRSKRDVVAVIYDVNLKWLIYSSFRNDSLFNNYNLIISMKWLTNIDVFLCTNFKSILHYIAKYCFKVETKSLKLKVIVQSVLSHVSSKALMLSLASRLMNKLIAKKDWSAQKVCHHLLKRELTHSFKIIQTFDLRSNVQRRYLFKLESNDVTSNITFVEKYCSRSSKQTKLILFQIFKYYVWNARKKKFKKRSRKRLKILNVFSLYSIDFAHKNYVDFYRMKLMLHHSFRFVDLSNLLRAIEYDNWRKIYNHCRAHHDHSFDSLEVSFDSIDAESDIENLKANNVNQNVQHEEFLNKRYAHHTMFR